MRLRSKSKIVGKATVRIVGLKFTEANVCVLGIAEYTKLMHLTFKNFPGPL